MYPEELFSEEKYKEIRGIDEYNEDADKIIHNFMSSSNAAYRTTLDFENCSTEEETAEHIKQLIEDLKDVIGTLEAALKYIEDYTIN